MGGGSIDARPGSEQQTTRETTDDGERPACGSQIRCGERLGRYTLVSRVGMGGGGVVYAAYDDALARPVALKVLWRGAHDPERLAREARAIAELDHPNIVTVYDVGVDRGRSFVVMELVDGGSMRHWLERTRPAPARIVAMVLHAARGLAHAHGRGIVHRDFKLDNVLVSRQGRVLVTDFGLASRLGAAPRPAMAGTLPYMAPEQHAGEAVGHPADQFALCVGLFYALHGFHPFEGESADALHQAKRAGAMRPVERRVVPRRVYRAIARGLSARPGDRFASMHALIAAIEGRRHRRWIPAAALLLALGGVWLALPSRPPDPCPDSPALWSRRDADRVHQALRSTGTSFAESTGERVDQLLSAYAREWSSNRTQVCERMARASVPQRSALTATERCLHRARLRVDALAAELGRIERDAVDYAVQAAELLPSPERCWQHPEPVGRWDDPAWVELESQLAQVQAHEVIGSFQTAASMADRIAASAEAAAAPELIVRAHLLRGRAQIQLAHHDQGQQALERAYFGAIAIGDDDSATEAAVELLRVATRDRVDLDQARLWDRAAQAIAARSPPYPESEAKLLYARAEHAITAGDPQTWVALHREALAIRRRADRPSLSLAESLEGLGRAQLHTDHSGPALALLEEALQIRQALLGEQHPWLAVAHNNYGVALAVVDQQERAREHLETGLRILESSLGPRHPRVGRALSNFGRFILMRGESSAAREYLTRAVTILGAAHGPDHHETLTARQNLIKAMLRDGPPEPALALARLMLTDVESGAPSPMLLASVHALLGLSLLGVDDHEAALASYRRALVLVEGTPAAKKRRPYLLYGVAQAQVGLGRDEEATLAAEQARAQTDERDLESRVARLLAGIELRRGRHEEALALAHTARDTLPSWARADLRRVRSIDELIERIQRRSGAAPDR